MHALALVDDQVSVLLEPLFTAAGAADSETVGAGVGGGSDVVTATETLPWPVPADPVQRSVNVELAVNAPVDWLPEVDFDPLQAPDAVHELALVDDHVSVLLPPLPTEAGEADKVTLGRLA